MSGSSAQPIVSRNPGSFPLDELVNLLTDPWKTALTRADGRLNKAGLQRQFNGKRRIPTDFWNAFKQKYPNFFFPAYTPETTPDSDEPLQVTRRNRSHYTATSSQVNSQADSTWAAGDESGDEANVNENVDVTETIPEQSPPTPQASVARSRDTEQVSLEIQATNDVNDDEDEQPPPDRHAERRRKFTWFLNDWAGDQDEYNERNEDGTLRPPKKHAGPIVDKGHLLEPSTPLPANLLTDVQLDYWESILDVNGKVYYSAEQLALGALSKSEYMLVPVNWKIDICPVSKIGSGLGGYKVDMLTMSAVYSLAKKQAADLKLPPEDQIKWAVLRMEAFKAGWFDGQKYTMFKPAPPDSLSTMTDDLEKIGQFSDTAYVLCAFLPYMAEFHFRAFGSSYTAGNAADYVAKAQTLAQSASISSYLTYMDQSNLFGRSLSWIGVKRPMQALRDPEASSRIPNPFIIRAKSAPAGQAIITTSVAVINSMKALGWWSIVKYYSKVDDRRLCEVCTAITNNPWRYHLMSHVFGEAPLTAADTAGIEEAKASAVKFAPILQAYVETMMKDTPLSRIQSLKKHAHDAHGLYKGARNFFLKVSKAKADTIAQVFKSEAFRLVVTGAEDIAALEAEQGNRG